VRWPYSEHEMAAKRPTGEHRSLGTRRLLIHTPLEGDEGLVREMKEMGEMREMREMRG
jgi:hypothetical protein